MKRLTALLAAVILAASMALPAIAAAQDGTEILRGRVLETDKRPIQGVTITVTGLNTQAVRTATTDGKGNFTLLFSPPEGDYILNVRKIGYSPVTFRSTRTGLSNMMVTGDIVLSSMAVKLDSITVTARGKSDASVGGLDKDLLSGALFTLNPSDLLSLITSLPGVLALGDSSFSVLGAAGNQNNATLDGVAFGGNNLPRDAAATTRLVTTSADISKAGFAGGQTEMTMRGGTDIFSATARAQFADSHLAWADPSSPIPVPRFGSTSGFIGGPIVKQKSHYQFSWDGGNRSTEAWTLAAPRESILSQYGVLADTVSAVSSALRGLGVPLTASGIPERNKEDNVSTSLALDFAPKATTTIRISANTYWYGSGGPSGGGLSFPSNASQNKGSFQFGSARLSGYLHGFLDELSLSLNRSTSHGDPYILIPGGSVRVGTQFSDGRTGLSSLQFGGGGGISRYASTQYSLQNELSLITPKSKHKIKVGQQLTHSANTSYSANNLVGAFTYQTLADLQANRPASFNRTLTTYERSSSGNTAAGWVGDDWQPSKALTLQGGIRIDASHSDTRPGYNPTVDQLFGLRTDIVPNDIGWSPRLGFSWTSPARRGKGSASSPQSFREGGGEIPAELMMMMMMRGGGGRPTQLPGFTVSGSAGAYRGATSNSRIASLVDVTGLPSTRTTLSCVGAATPIPDWNTIGGNSPDACLDGTAPGTFSVSQPTVSVFDRSFRAPVSWRGNLTIDGIRLKKWNLLLSGVYSFGVNGESGLDLNLKRTAGFNLASEGGRPVYVSPLDVVPTTGGIAPGASRIYSQYGRVTNTISDLHNWSEQINATITPPHPLLKNKLNLALTYVWSHSRAETRGFGVGGGFGGGFAREVVFSGGGDFVSFGGGGGSGTTSGDPFVKEWVPGTQATHQFTLTTSLRAWWFNFNIRTNVYSGFPYTPTVVGDVNGDGAASNDRAYVANPATTTDPELASQLTALLATAPSGARDCIRSQMGKIAGANSCHTQWQARMDLNMNFSPPQNWGFGDRLRLTTTMVNASGALVRLFGLQDTPLGQYSAQVRPDSRLLYVTGFNPTTQQFQYRVNQLFGSPLGYGNNRTKSAPFQMQIGLEYKLGGPPTSPMARGLGLMPDKGESRLSPDDVRSRLQKLSRDPIAPILARKDTLRLTPEQVTQMEAIASDFHRTADSLLAPIVAYVVKKGKKVADTDLSPKLAKAQPLIAKAMAAATVKATELLTPAQKMLMPAAAPGAGAPAGARPGVTGAPTGGGETPVKPGGGPVTVKSVGGGGGEQT